MHRLKAWLAVWAFAVAALAQGGFDPLKSVTVRIEKGAVVATAPEGAHLKAAFMKVEKDGGPGKLVAGPLPAGNAKDELEDDIWHGPVRIPLKGEGLAGEVTLKVTYQPCTEGIGGVCYPPTVQTLKVKAADIPGVKAVEAPKAVEASRAAEPTPAPLPKEAQPIPANLAPKAAPTPDSQGLLFGFFVVFLAGLGASLTPCVFPMIPITMAIIGAKGSGKAKGFALSMALVLGMAVTYTVLGVVAAKSGAAAGSMAQKPAFLIPVSLLFGAFALSLFGAFEIRLPQGLQAKLQGDGPRKGYGGAFVMGLVMGPISAPCVGPVIGTVLLNIAQKGDVVLGAAQLFTFALGMGVLFIAVGTFSAALPKSGDWLDRFKQGMGLIVLGFAAWNVRLVVEPWMNPAMWMLVTFTAAVVLGAFRATETLLGGLAKALGILSLALGVLLGIRAVELSQNLQLLPRGDAAAESAKTSLWIEQDYEQALARAKVEGKVVLVDTYAEWCAQCHELDEKTWPDAAVQAWVKAHAIAVRIDTDKVRPDLATKLGIRSYPTILVLDAEGKELKRSLGFQPPAAMRAWLEG
ncbi:MAG TPA: cytochrome c biogenesis protein CcdA [Holophagaceae bacterium]|nr:cytochrome c biogenesis protein CcdA [Holophagaceae bacterium]